MTGEMNNRAVEHQRRERKLLFDERDLDGALAMWADNATRTIHDQAGLVVSKAGIRAWNQDIVANPATIN